MAMRTRVAATEAGGSVAAASGVGSATSGSSIGGAGGTGFGVACFAATGGDAGGALLQQPVAHIKMPVRNVIRPRTFTPSVTGPVKQNSVKQSQVGGSLSACTLHPPSPALPAEGRELEDTMEAHKSICPIGVPSAILIGRFCGVEFVSSGGTPSAVESVASTSPMATWFSSTVEPSSLVRP